MNKLQRSLGCLLAIACTAAATMQAQARLDTGWSLGGGALNRGGTLDVTRRFEAGKSYLIIADGDSSARDVDLLVLDSRGRVVEKDEGARKEAQVRFRPRNSGNYTIRLKMANARGRAIGYFAVFRLDGGWNVPQRDVDAAVARLAALSALVDLADYRLDRFFGRIMYPGERQTLSFSGLTLGNHSIAAVGDDLAHDLDLIVSQYGEILDIDDEPDAVPITEFRASGRVEANVEFPSGSGPALVLVALYSESAPSGGFGQL